MRELSPHHLRIKGRDEKSDDAPEAEEHAEAIRSWLTALVGGEHVSLLVGSGLPVAAAHAAKVAPLVMNPVTLGATNAAEVDAHAKKTAEEAQRGAMNIEDQLRSALQLLAGLEVLKSDDAPAWRMQIDHVLRVFAKVRWPQRPESALPSTMTTPKRGSALLSSS